MKGEFNAGLLSNLTSTVIVQGIDKQRANILQEITNRRCLGISSYNLMQSLNDAIRYQSACSTDVGVAAAGSVLSQSQKIASPTTADVASAIDTMTALNAKMKTAMMSGPTQADRPTPGAAKGNTADKDAPEPSQNQPPVSTL